MAEELVPPEILNQLTDQMLGTFQPVLETVGLIIGGAFGIYVLLAVARIYNEKKKINLLQDIRYDLEKLNVHFGVSTSKHKRGVWKRFTSKISGMLHPGPKRRKK